MSGLAHDLETLRRRAHRFILVRGAAAVIATIVGMGVLLGSLDSLVRWPDQAGRWAQSAIWLASIFAVGWIYLVRPLRAQLTHRDLAQLIHRRWPAQTPDLTSAVEFESAQFNSDTGAPLLQQVTASRAQLQLATVPWQTVVAPQRTYGALASAALSLVVFGLAVMSFQETAAVGALRLTSPWMDLDWPRRVTLVYLDRDFVPIDTSRSPAVRTGQGEPLTIYIQNRTGSLPAKVKFERQTLTGEREQGELRQATLTDSQGLPHQVAVATPSSLASFKFRALGGDDDRAPWMTINVVPPPRVQSFDITLTPPQYTGRPPEITTSGVGHLQGLVGSRIDIRCRATTPLQSAILNQDNSPRQTLTISPDHQEFTLDWTISAAERSTYWLDLTDSLGLRASNPPRYEIRGVADLEPVVTLLTPSSDLRVTPDAEISIAGEARDDLGLRLTELVYEIPAAASTTGTATPSVPLEQHAIPLGPTQPGQLEQSIQTTWKLAELNLAAGTQVRFWLQAKDACDLHGMNGQVGRSAVRVISILTPEEKQQEFSSQQLQIAERIHQLRDKQATLEQSTREIVEQWKSIGSLRPAEIQELENLQVRQSELSRELGQGSGSVLGELKTLQQERASNQLNDPQSSESLARWEATLAPLAEEVLPDVVARLEATRQGVASNAASQPRAKEQATEALNHAHSGQLRTLDDLTRLSSELAEWRRDEDLDKRLDDIARRQSELREQSLAIGQQTSAKSLTDLSSQEQTDLARAADRQISLARDVEHLASQLEANASPTNPSPIDAAVADMAKQLADLSVAATMRDASDALRQNHIQSATDTQQGLIDTLNKLKMSIEQQRSQSARSELETLRKSMHEAQELAKRQAELRRRTEALTTPSADSQRATNAAETQQLQQELADQTEELAQRLRLDQKSDTSGAARRASERMLEAQASLEQDQVPQTLERQSEALDELKQVQDSLDQAVQKASIQADQERISSVGQLIVALRERAQATLEETARLEQLRTSQGKWTRSQLKSVQLAAESQRDISQSCEEAKEQLGSSGVLGLCISMAAEHFQTAATQLGERNAGNQTQSQQQAGIQLLDQFIASLSPPTAPNAQEQPNAPQEAANVRNQTAGASPLMAAEVRLLLKMQEEILATTRGLADVKSQGQTLTDEQTDELNQLRDRQKRLAQTARSMISKQKLSDDHVGPVEEIQP
ncbi:MAG: DUF4175 family protein [Planctomycetaceae bacterium]